MRSSERAVWQHAIWYWKETGKVLDRTNAELEELIEALDKLVFLPVDDETESDDVKPHL